MNEANSSKEIQSQENESVLPIVSQESVDAVIDKLEINPAYFADALNRLNAEQIALGHMIHNMYDNGAQEYIGIATLLVLEEQLRADQDKN